MKIKSFICAGVLIVSSFMFVGCGETNDATTDNTITTASNVSYTSVSHHGNGYYRQNGGCKGYYYQNGGCNGYYCQNGNCPNYHVNNYGHHYGHC